MCKARNPSNQVSAKGQPLRVIEKLLLCFAHADLDGNFRILSEPEEEWVRDQLKKTDWSPLVSELGAGANMLGTVWDGVCHRFIIQTECPCGDNRCVGSSTRIASVGVQLNEEGSQKVNDEQLRDPKVKPS